jgi:TPR repeat protein
MEGDQSVEALQLLADQGNTIAQCSLGMMYHLGQGVAQDFGRAAVLYQQSADQGHADAQCHLGQLYATGKGVAQDFGRAAVLYQQSADQGDALAQYNLGFLYATGDGGAQDYGRAAVLWQQSADQGKAFAQYNLGQLYAAGQGVAQDFGRAAVLFQKAADQGLENAITQLQKMEAEAAAMAQGEAMAISRAGALADAMAQELIREEEAGSSKKKKHKKIKKKAKGSTGAARAEEQSCRAATNCSADAASVKHAQHAARLSAANEAVREALGAATLEQLTAALDMHGLVAEAALVAEARTLRKQLKEKQRKQRTKAEKRGRAISTLQQAMDSGTDVIALVNAIEAAQRLDGADGMGLLSLLDAARDRLAHARVEQTAAQKQTAIETTEKEFMALALSHGADAEECLQASAEDQSKLCVVCLAEPRDFVLVPCGHICLCTFCVAVVFAHGEKICPLCRSEVEATYRVYQ